MLVARAESDFRGGVGVSGWMLDRFGVRLLCARAQVNSSHTRERL